MKSILSILALTMGISLSAQEQPKPEGGATETTPSYSEYFSWINNCFEGGTAAQTQTNLEFFNWLHDRYGMTLDIYALDAGNIDGWLIYGNTKSDYFKHRYPEGFSSLGKYAAKMGTRLGMWCGPDGFGDTKEEADEREEMMVSLVRDNNFGLFKMDACCGTLRNTKYEEFDRMMTRVRQYDPHFILLNHRLDLGPGTRHSTTFLLGGAETYADVHMNNSRTCTHHRLQNIERQGPDNLTRLTEDHGVCLSSCMDYWEDDLILQAFSRELILSPEIYGNPWLLSDDEFPQLAYIYNLHRRYRDILPTAKRLDEAQYGPEALSRGNEKTRFIALRNLGWNPVTYKVRISDEIGLKKTGKKVQVRLYHPYILDMGQHKYGEEVEVTVEPFRAALVKLTTETERDPILISGIPYQIINDCGQGAKEVKLLGWPGETYTYRINGQKAQTITFPGTPLKEKYHRQLAKMEKCDVPSDAATLYDATVYAADNNALEVRSLYRSGETLYPEVKAARDAFFNQDLFVERDVWDRNLFDGNQTTGFAIAQRYGDQRGSRSSGMFLDLGKPTSLDELEIDIANQFEMSPLKTDEGLIVYLSSDLKEWKQITSRIMKQTHIDLKGVGAFRYLKLTSCPLRLTEIAGYKDGKKVSTDGWKVNNLFRFTNDMHYQQAYKSDFKITEASVGSYLCIAVNGRTGNDGAWAALKVGDQYVGCPDRAPSYLSNTWECPIRQVDGNYTFYVPVTQDMVGKNVQAWVLGTQTDELQPEVWITAYPIPFQQKIVTVK